VTQQFKHAKSDGDLFNVITRGISGTTMPPFALAPDEVWAIIAFLRSSQVAAHAGVQGNNQNGERLFMGSAKCVTCHMVNGQGGVLGPDLSRIGARRTVAYLTDKLRNPSGQLTTGLREPNADYVTPFANSTVTIVSKDGQRITGIPKNEDTFSIQVLGVDGKLHVFLKRNLAEIHHQQRSLMPAYTERELSDSDLRDVLAYLATLQGGSS
jgi:putative heme-binding domain-containing protein